MTTQLNTHQTKIIHDRYSLKNPDGTLAETTVQELWDRVARGISEIEPVENRDNVRKEFRSLLEGFKFLPAGRILAGAGTGNAVTFYNCFVIPQPEDSRGGIIESLGTMTEIMARGGGVGINFSSLRPRGSYISSVNGTASGPVSWIELFSVATGKVIQQGGTRRGALMAMLDDDHPDIMEFIEAKEIDPLTLKPKAIEHANVSVAISDAFMEAVEKDLDWVTQFPTKANILPGEAIRFTKTYRARDIWNRICERAWTTAEPGVIFIDRYNKRSNTWYYEDIRTTNPCGEQGLPSWGVCNLGHMNLSAYCMKNPDGTYTFDSPSLRLDVKTAMRFLDNVIDTTEYFLSENEEQQKGTRRTGLGTTGLADCLIKLGLKYGSHEAITFIEQTYENIRNWAYEASISLSRERGPFLKYDQEKYLQGEFIRELPEYLQYDIEKYGIRNAVVLSQAPTGTVSLLSNVSSGIEPNFSFVTQRTDRTGTSVIYHDLMQEFLENNPGSVPPSYFVSSDDLTVTDHIRTQAAIQKYTDASISKTVVAPTETTVEDVQKLYQDAYDLGCKGVTFYRDGSRDAVLVSLDKKEGMNGRDDNSGDILPDRILSGTSLEITRTRSKVLNGYTTSKEAPEGTTYVTINSDDEGPREVFVNVGRSGSDIAALSEAIGRLCSLVLRLPSSVSADDRISLMADQLIGLGGSGSTGFGQERVRSLPDAIGQVFADHGFDRIDELVEELIKETPKISMKKPSGDFCPQCGTIMVRQEGCFTCPSCAYSKCS